MSDIGMVRELVKLMRAQGVYKVRMGDVEIVMGSANALEENPVLTLDKLNSMDLDEDDPMYEFRFDERQRLEALLKQRQKEEEEMDVYGAG